MSSGRAHDLASLPPHLAGVLADARRAVLSTTGADGAPHAIPVCHAVAEDEIVIEVDAKPKGGGELVRVRNIRARPAVALLADLWDEDWTRLAWVMVRGDARIEAPGYRADALLRKYEQYRQEPPSGPVIAIRPRVVSWWTWT